MLVPLTIGLTVYREGGPSGSGGVSDNTSSEDALGTPVVDVMPLSPVCTDNLICYVNSNSTPSGHGQITASYAWYKDGVLQAELTSDNVDSGYIAKGQTWRCVVTISDGAGASADGFDEVTIGNTQPTAPAADVTPDSPAPTDDLVCSITVPSSDLDADNITYTYAWYKDGTLQADLTGNTIDSSYTDEGQVWRCAVAGSDGDSTSASSYDEVTIESEMKAIYVWSWSWQLFDKTTEAEYFLATCRDEEIDTAFIAATDSDVLDYIQNSPAKIRGFIENANANGIQVYALLARMNYGVEAALQPNVEAILKYNHDNPDCKFEGIHFDLEPPGGSSLTQHAAYLAECTTFFQHIKKWSYDGETITSQGVALGMFVDPRWSRTQCAAAYSSLVRELDYMDIAAYRAPPETGMSEVQGCVDLTVAEGKPFAITLETAEFSYNSDGATTYYEEGKAGLENCMSVMRAYYKANYPGHFMGFVVHHYENCISAWHTINSVQWPSGSYSAGESVSVTVTLHASDYYYWRPYGVKLEVRDSAGNIWVTSKIVCMHYSSNTKQVTLTWTVPSEAAAGDCDVKVSLWDVDVHDEGHYSKLFYSDFSSKYYGDSSGQRAALEAYSMEELAALTHRPADPTQVLTGKRSQFIELQSSGWNVGVFSLA